MRWNCCHFQLCNALFHAVSLILILNQPIVCAAVPLQTTCYRSNDAFGKNVSFAEIDRNLLQKAVSLTRVSISATGLAL